ncbi:FadR family transcriptional regulator [Roseomonas sp. OT10]|uniref:FadR/GntR family transcriptional regulator n=1 Tax=Roseomonas cutis TaxID=2897332 RepID=UPI001E3CE28A|nr:FadR/GntR family transcriptional regulator [Roseomonas sp. OT10]UFN50322.1 FadR family transcriptional regulator [Roseomonas sp. OT10]
MATSPTPPRRRPSLTQQVTRDLLAEIERGGLRPGDPFPTERELTARYGVSRTVIREAMSSLRASGRLVVEQGRGAFIGTPSPTPYRLDPAEIGTAEDLLRLMELRIALESEAAALAAQRRDAPAVAALARLAERFAAGMEDSEASRRLDLDFHRQIAAMTGNPYFGQVLDSFAAGLLPRARLDLFRDDPMARAEYQRRLQLEHAHILEAIARGDAEGARAAMRLHLSNSRERLRRAREAIAEAP